MFIASLSIFAKDWKQANYPPTESINQLWYNHMMEHYSAIKRTINILNMMTLK